MPHYLNEALFPSSQGKANFVIGQLGEYNGDDVDHNARNTMESFPVLPGPINPG